ncbi:hypothetical protein [Nitrosomonas sp. ANs5]|uniref:hypothetical protein n=1 Tax=Nitrosomonas sp. ANs5 TaxID=3423941 RepID=UPI003D33F3C8
MTKARLLRNCLEILNLSDRAVVWRMWIRMVFPNRKHLGKRLGIEAKLTLG